MINSDPIRNFLELLARLAEHRNICFPSSKSHNV